MEDIKALFRNPGEGMTVYVVERSFAENRGQQFFSQYKGTKNYISADKNIRAVLDKIAKKLVKYLPNIAEIVAMCLAPAVPVVSLCFAISGLMILFGVNEHQAASKHLDPMIIEEKGVEEKHLNQLVSLYKDSIIKPTIIIILKDNDFERAKKDLSKLPDKTNVIMFRNSGEKVEFKVMNTGADSLAEFLELFSNQCFNTCSNTPKEILLPDELTSGCAIKRFAPNILRLRTQMLFNDKTLIRAELDETIKAVSQYDADTEYDRSILASFLCILKLYRVFCHDGGRRDIQEALSIAKALDDDLLLAYVYRQAFFLDQYSVEERGSFLELARDTFRKHKLNDHAIYCSNNLLIKQLDTGSVNEKQFIDLKDEAVNTVPGLVGMSHIFNNAGVAHLIKGDVGNAMNYFNEGLEYANSSGRIIQKIAIKSNQITCMRFECRNIPETYFYEIFNLIFFNKEALNLPFLTARYALNTLVIAARQNKGLGKHLIDTYPIKTLIENALNDNILGSGQILFQLNLLKTENDPAFDLLSPAYKIGNIAPLGGARKEFMEKTGLNFHLFSIWF